MYGKPMIKGDVETPATPERRRSPRCAFAGRLSVWAGTRRYELQAVNAGPGAALVEAPAGLLGRPERLVGSLCIFSFEAAGYPLGPLRRRVTRCEVRDRSPRGGRLVLMFD